MEKVLILFVRSCHCVALIRGLQNLGTPFGKGFNSCGAKLRLRRADSRFAEPRSFPERERFSYFSRVRKVPKVHQRFANLWTPGTIQSSAGSEFAKAFRRLISKPVLPAKRRRKGFESVRKGYRSADARLIFFENGLLYCKLTVGCRR